MKLPIPIDVLLKAFLQHCYSRPAQHSTQCTKMDVSQTPQDQEYKTL